MVTELDDFASFYERTYANAYRLAIAVTGSRAAAEDATQQAFCDAYRRRHKFRGDGSPDAWLLRTVVNRSIDELRRARRHGLTLAFDLVEYAPECNEIGAGDPFLRDAIARLKPEQRAAIVLRYYHGYPVQIIGGMLSTSPNGASMLLSRALQNLRADLAEEKRAKKSPSRMSSATRSPR